MRNAMSHRREFSEAAAATAYAERLKRRGWTDIQIVQRRGTFKQQGRNELYSFFVLTAKRPSTSVASTTLRSRRQPTTQR
jgi:hypothetical protein